MMKSALLALALIAAGFGSAAADTTLPWVKGWDNFGEPLNLKKSGIRFFVAPGNKLAIGFTLTGATPNKLYQMAITIFGCTAEPPTFGQFSTDPNGCSSLPRQGVTANVWGAELAVVLTDARGNGQAGVIVDHVAPGTYQVQFQARDGAGCFVNGGSDSCDADFESSGPFGTTTTITIP